MLGLAAERAVERSQVKLSSVGMAGSTPLLQLAFKDVTLADTSAAALWEQVRAHAHALVPGTGPWPYGCKHAYQGTGLMGACVAIHAQALAGRFGEARGLEPAFWLRGQAVQRIASAVSLREAGAPAEVTLELAVTLPALRPLPSSKANAVPDPASGVPTRPPGAFTVRCCCPPLWARHASIESP